MRVSCIWLSAATIMLAACSSCSSSTAKGFPSGDGGGSSSGSSSGGSGSGGGDSGQTITPTQACADVAGAVCGRLNACTPFGLQVAYGDKTTCAQRAALACAATVGVPGSAATPAQIDQCAQAMSGQTCDEWLDNAQPSACAFTGTLAASAACGDNAQCQSGYCRVGLGSTCGTCQSRVSAGETAPDGGPICAVDTDCMATLVCNAGTCVSPAAKGASCGTSQPCLRSLVCSGGTCVAPLPAASGCPSGNECDAAHGGYCNAQSKTCMTLGTASAGQPCGLVNGAVVACVAGATCGNISSSTGQGTCHQPAADGAVCGPDISCMAPAVCTTAARCTLPTPSTCH